MVRYYRRVIKISALDSPNVRYALAQIKAGQEPTGEVVLPGVLPWHDYQKRLKTWDPVRICIGLNGDFWEGADTLLFPPEWLTRAELLAELLRGKPRQARGIGVDTAEGGDKTTMAAVDEFGLLDLTAELTPNTAVIPGKILAFMTKHGVPADRVCLDRGGGGKQHADYLRAQGHNVRTVAFGEAVTPEDQRRTFTSLRRLRQAREERYIYCNRRAELFGTLRLLLEPFDEDVTPVAIPTVPASATPIGSTNPNVAGFAGFIASQAETNRAVMGRARGFALPAMYTELRRQLSVIPLLYDKEGRLALPPKTRKGTRAVGEKTLVDLIGNSPDECDSLVLAVKAMLDTPYRPKVGSFFNGV